MEQLRRDGVALAYEEAGSGAPPVVLVHDLGSDHTCFAPQFEYFRCHHRVVAVDLRGHGQSDKPSQACTVSVLADDLAWLCYELGLYRPVILGHGLGALVALDLASRYQDLPGAVVVMPTATSPTALVTSIFLNAGTRQNWGVTFPEETNPLVERFLSALADRAPP